MRTRHKVGIIVLLCLCFLRYFYTGGILRGDGACYYVYLKSIFIEGGINFSYNPFPIGPPLLWSPFFLAGHLMELYAAKRGKPIIPDGFTPFTLWATTTGSMIYGLIGIGIIFLFLRNFYPEKISIPVTLIIFISTPALYYIIYEPSMSHSVSIFASSLFFYCWYRYRGDMGLKARILVGICGGLMVLVRWQSIVYLALGLLDIIVLLKKRKENALSFSGNKAYLWKVVRANLLMLIFVFILFLPQLLAWKAIYGSYLTMPQGKGFMRWYNPQILKSLFSPHNGLFYWNPIFFIATIGMVIAILKYRKSAHLLASKFTINKAQREDEIVFYRHLPLFMFIFFLLQIYINSSVWDWWAGASFGGRRYMDLLIIFALGLAEIWQIIERKQKWLKGFFIGLLAFLCVWNILFIEQYWMELIKPLQPAFYHTVAKNNLIIIKGLAIYLYTLPEKVMFYFSAGLPIKNFNGEIFKKPEVEELFLDFDKEITPYLGDGWSIPEVWPGEISVMWAMGKRSYILIPPLKCRNYKLLMKAVPFGYIPFNPQVMRVKMNNQFLGEIVMDQSWREYEILIPSSSLSLKGNALKIEYQRSYSPYEIGDPDFKIGETGVFSPFDLYLEHSSIDFGYSAHIVVDGKNLSPEKRGYNVVVIDPQIRKVSHIDSFDVFMKDEDADRMVKFINNLPEGAIVAIALKEWGSYFATSVKEIVEIIKEFGKNLFQEKEEIDWQMRIQSLFFSVINLEEARTEFSFRLFLFKNRYAFERSIAYLESLPQDKTAFMFIEWEGMKDPSQKLKQSFEDLGIKYTPYMTVAIGVKGAKPGTAVYSRAPFKHNILYIGRKIDKRKLSAAFDYIKIVPAE